MAINLVTVMRGNEIESIHKGDVVIVKNGALIKALGDPYKKTFWRSAAKPFQVLPLLQTDAYHFTEKELAIMTASHGGEKPHVEVVRSLLNKQNYSIDDLDCGVSRPMCQKATDDLLKSNQSFTSANNPCSGKHTGMLLLLKHFNWPLKDYIDLKHPLQQVMLKTIADICELPEPSISIAIDGCGVPVFGMPIFNMALAYGKLDGKDKYFEQIKKAMTGQPFYVAGSGRLDTIIMTETRGKILAKLGAESVYCMTVVNQGIGIAVKIEDGAYRALDALIPDLLLNEKYITKQEHVNITSKLNLNVLNHRKQIVGRIQSTILES